MSPATSAMPLSLSHLPPGAPWWIIAIVAGALALHIGGGTIGIVSGYGAVTVRKGERLHRRLGTIFVVSMLVMAVCGTALSILIQQRSNIAGGILAAYLVTTAWLTVKRPDGIIGAPEKVAALIPIGVSILFLVWGIQATMNGGHLDGYGSPLYYVFSVIAALMAGLDFRVIRRGGVSGPQRIARHLWRMCFALFFAAGSFFLGQQKVMPAFMHGSRVLLVLGLAPLGFLIFWLIRVRFTKWFQRADTALHSDTGRTEPMASVSA